LGGFTLIELILVMVIIATMMAVISPALRGFTSERQVENAARMLVAMTEWARLRAATEGRAWRLNIEINDRDEGDVGYFWLTAQDGLLFEEPGESFARAVDLPLGVRMEWEDSEEAETNDYIQFEADGTKDTARIRLIGKSGVVYDVYCSSPSEPFRVERMYDEERYYD
jgi:prepilin-type N-terminal cleavage/methylation domain-containing protein